MIRSPLMTVMVDAVMKAAKGLRRDFGEVENLQVSRKGPGDFVSAADHKAEKVIRESLEKARPDYGFVMEESGIVEGKDAEPPLAHRSARRHDELPARHPALRAFRSGSSARASSSRASIYDPGQGRAVHRRARQGRLPQQPPHARLRAHRRGRRACSAPASPASASGDHPGFLKQLALVMMQTSPACAASAPRRSTSPMSRAGPLDAYWEHGLNSWDVAAGALMVREAGGFVSDAFGKDEVLAADTIVSGNEAMHQALAQARCKEATGRRLSGASACRFQRFAANSCGALISRRPAA